MNNDMTTPPSAAIKPTFGKNAWTVLGIFFGIVVVLLAAFLYLISETGLIRIPVFSSFYKGPQPTRTVKASSLDAEAFRGLISDRVLAQAATGAKPPYVVRLTEGELTGALRGSIVSAAIPAGWEVENPQVVITPKGIEFYGKMQSGPLHADVLIRFGAMVENGGLQFIPQGIYFGDYPVHPDMAQRLASQFFARDFGTWTITFGEARLESVDLQDGVLELKAAPASL